MPEHNYEIIEKEQLKVEADEFWDNYIINEECDCMDCRVNNLELELGNIFNRFNIPFVPITYKNNEGYLYDTVSSTPSFLGLWYHIFDAIYVYNIKMIKKSEQSNKSLVHCWECGKLTYKNKNRLIGENENQLCITCAKNYVTCHFCESLFNKYDVDIRHINIQGVGKVHTCEKCFTAKGLPYNYCSNCDSYELDKKDMIEVVRQRDPNTDELTYMSFCSFCGSRHKKCSTFGCNELSYNIGSLSKCAACKEEEIGLHSYNYKPIRRYFNYSKFEKNINIDTSLFFGFELETESDRSTITRSTMSHLVSEIIGKRYVYCMKDGSLENGIEIASFPFTWDWYKRIGKEKWTELLLFLKNKGWRGDLPGNDHSRTVGFHVHTTKAAWSSLQIYKLIQFVYNPINRNFISLISDRPPVFYSRISSEDFDGSVELAKLKKNITSDHYNMINLNKKSDASQPGKTIEFRMFKGTIEPMLFHKNLEFIQAIYMFTKDHSKKEMFKDNFVRYIIKHKKEYTCLMEHLRNNLDIKYYLNSK